MSVARTPILKEAADLHRFLLPMARMCAVNPTDHPYYSKASYEFFTYIRALVESTILYLESLPRRTYRFPDIEYSIRQKLRVLRHSWGRIHRYVKPALDADTLHIPLALLMALSAKVKEIQGCSAFDFALFHTEQHNYLMLTNEEVGKIAGRIAACVQANPFPSHLSLVGIPYSQASGLLLNCLIPHEMAHFVYQEKLNGPICDHVDSILSDYYPEENAVPAESLTRIRSTIISWVEEIFCDLFALTILGPSFTFAFAEFTSASLLVNAPADYAEHFQFGWAHPAMVARFHLHRKYLESLGWWDQIKDWKSAPVELLKYCEMQRDNTTVPEVILNCDGAALNLRCFWDACDWLVPFVRERLPDPKDTIEEFADLSSTISDYLAQAIVPSTLIMGGQPRNPSPVVLINAAFRFVLEEFDRLLGNVEDVSADSIRDRSRYAERIELWILKAIEDFQLLKSQRGR